MTCDISPVHRKTYPPIWNALCYSDNTYGIKHPYQPISAAGKMSLEANPLERQGAFIFVSSRSDYF